MTKKKNEKRGNTRMKQKNDFITQSFHLILKGRKEKRKKQTKNREKNKTYTGL